MVVFLPRLVIRCETGTGGRVIRAGTLIEEAICHDEAVTSVASYWSHTDVLVL